ncbi:DNA-methyltransferase [Streptomyces niveus]|uniref:DNA-methyltransferase n=1 Tax=Streptomyces niveus TaxID=193462 RepID=UPI0034187D7B
MKPYWQDDDGTVQLYHGDMREILPALTVTADLIVADPPYAETSLAWDRWPDGWLHTAASHSNAMWCFGSQRMFFQHLAEFETAGWKLSQDVVGHDEEGEPITADVNVVWEKHNGSGFAKDRFRRVHEHALHWYQGGWGGVRHDVPRVPANGGHQGGPSARAAIAHTGTIAPQIWQDNGTRLMRSVIKVRSMHGRGIHPTEKPVDLLDPLIRYGSPPGGLVLDPFAGSCSTLDAARQSGRRAIGIEAREEHCERAVKRLSELVLT